MNRYSVVIGDWSGDGHGKSETIYFDVNKTDKELKSAFNKVCKKEKIDFKNICAEYEDNSMSENLIKFLTKNIEKYVSFLYPEVTDGQLTIQEQIETLSDQGFDSPEEYVKTILFICSFGAGMSDLVYKIVEDDVEQIEFVDGFLGYGLFY